jgi:hypothetical protein
LKEHTAIIITEPPGLRPYCRLIFVSAAFVALHRRPIADRQFDALLRGEGSLRVAHRDRPLPGGPQPKLEGDLTPNQVTSTLNSLPQYSAACLPWAHQLAFRPILEKAALSAFSDRPATLPISAASAGERLPFSEAAARPAVARNMPRRFAKMRVTECSVLLEES